MRIWTPFVGGVGEMPEMFVKRPECGDMSGVGDLCHGINILGRLRREYRMIAFFRMIILVGRQIILKTRMID